LIFQQLSTATEASALASASAASHHGEHAEGHERVLSVDVALEAVARSVAQDQTDASLHRALLVRLQPTHLAPMARWRGVQVRAG